MWRHVSLNKKLLNKKEANMWRHIRNKYGVEIKKKIQVELVVCLN